METAQRKLPCFVVTSRPSASGAADFVLDIPLPPAFGRHLALTQYLNEVHIAQRATHALVPSLNADTAR